MPNQRAPLTLLSIFLAFQATLSLSGCAGVPGASTTAASSNSSTAPAGLLAASATSLSFGNVTTGSSSSQTLTLTNTGAAAVTISQATISGAGFSVVEGMSSVSIAAGRNHTFQVKFAPQEVGNVTGGIAVASDATNSPLFLSLSGTGTPAPSITTQPASQSVAAGQTATFTVAATGAGTLTYQWKKNGTAISGAIATSYTTPATTTSDNGAQFTVTVTNSVGTISSNAATLTVNAVTFLLNASTTSLSFATVNLGSSGILGTTFTNAGNSNVTISNVSISGAGYTASGVSTGQILTPGQTAILNVTFTPVANGNLTGTATVTSNATNSPATVSLSGTGVQPVAHSVTLTWDASPPAAKGYNVYRSSDSDASFTKLNSALITTTQYNDSTVQAGQTYFYAATSVNRGNVESKYSDQVSATVPTP